MEHSVEQWISTQSVRQFDFINPRVEDIHILDIARALSHICRFGGHTSSFYSVAEHSIIVAELLEDQFANKITILAGLLHDATEAYMGDMPRPIKASLPTSADTLFGAPSPYREKYLMLSEFITFTRFNLTGKDDSGVDWAHITDVDRRLCITEAKQLGLWNVDWADQGNELKFNLHLWTNVEAEHLFVMNFTELWEAIGR